MFNVLIYELIEISGWNTTNEIGGGLKYTRIGVVAKGDIITMISECEDTLIIY